MKRVLMVGSARESAGGVSSVIRLMEKMPVWKKYHCYWLGTQIQRGYLWKLWFAVKGNIIAFFIMWHYDIVHMHTTPDKLGLIIQLPILLWARILGKKIILQLHVGNQLRTKKNKLFVYCLRKADLIVLLAKKWQNLFGVWYPEVDVPTTVLYNACGYVPEVSHQEKKKVIIMAAWFNENKGTDILLKAVVKLKSTAVFEDWKVMMLGNGEVEKYRKMAEDLGLTDVVTFTGYVIGKTREKYLREASIYCMCSYEEGFPMVVLESWMYGINVVTTPVGGLPDVIEEGKNCMTFDFGDSDGLARQLQCLMENEDLRREMSDYSRRFVETQFTLDEVGIHLDKIYKSLGSID